MTNETQTRKFLQMNSSPHIHSPITTSDIMFEVIIALIPALIWGIYAFGLRALGVVTISVCSCVVFEYLYRKLAKKRDTISDLSAVVTGALLAFCLPSNIPFWIVFVGDFFAIVIVKQLYGGIGKNIVNPALAARVFLFMSFPSELSSSYPEPHSDVLASATPLASLQTGAVPSYSLENIIFGEIPGCIGEISATLVLLGGLYLLYRKVISWHIPVTYLVSVSLISLIFPQGDFTGFQFMLYELCSGGLMLGAMFIRYFGYPEGVSFAILVMNLFAFALDKITAPKKFGSKIVISQK